MDRNIKEFKSTLNLFIKDFWFVPSDALLRTPEALIWSKQKFNPPVLDIGCGDGQMSHLLFIGKGKIDVGLDSDPGGIERAKTSRVYKTVILADATKMPFKDNSFRTVVSNSTFEHIENDIQATKEVSRIIKKGGLFLFTVPTVRLEKVVREIIRSQKKFKTFNKRLSHYHYRSLKDWKKILEKSGLEIINTQYYFPQKTVRAWYKLFKIATFKPYRRELWSYLKDSHYRKFAPKKLIKFVLIKYLSGFGRNMFTREGCFIFIISRK